MNGFFDLIRELFARASEQMVGRLSGPLHLRFIITPTMAAVFGIRDGIMEARAGLNPFRWRVFTISDERKAFFKRGWKAIQKVVIVAVVFDVVYQVYVFRAFHIFQTVILVMGLALVPYMLIRGVTTRLMSLFSKN